LLLVALGGMTAAATWGVIELKKPRRWICLVFFREHALPRLQPDLINSSRRRTIGSPPVFRSSKCRSWRVG